MRIDRSELKELIRKEVNRSVKRHLAELPTPGKPLPSFDTLDLQSLSESRMYEYTDLPAPKTGSRWYAKEDQNLILSLDHYIGYQADKHERTRQALQWRIYKHLAWALQKREV